MIPLLIATLLLLLTPLTAAHPANTNLSTFEHGSSLVPRGMGEIDCPRLRPAKTDKHICYLGYQASKRDKNVVVDLSVWNSDCNKIGYATFVPPNGVFALNSQLKYVVMASVGMWRHWDWPPSIEYAGRHFDGYNEDGPMAYNCYYPDENNPNYKPELRKATRFCLVPFGC
ncbi:hypothetical protein DL98DRAFT_575524 [Cadophora sp. DSE1049]|nr:hypothetical protein DL98DRAFT_575524 [Cadophora sp. DSE1049]